MILMRSLLCSKCSKTLVLEIYSVGLERVPIFQAISERNFLVSKIGDLSRDKCNSRRLKSKFSLVFLVSLLLLYMYHNKTEISF